MLYRSFFIFVVLFASACTVTPNYGDTAFVCDVDSDCPSGLSCAEDGVCAVDPNSTPTPGMGTVPGTPKTVPVATCQDPIELLVDDFEDGEPGDVWTTQGLGVVEGEGVLSLSGAGDSAYQTTCPRPFTDSYTFVELTEVAIVDSGEITLSIDYPNSGFGIDVGVYRASALEPLRILHRVRLSGGGTVESFDDYDPTAHRWLQLETDGNSLVYRVSTNGVSWFDSFDIGTGLPTEAAVVSLRRSGDAVGQFDNLAGGAYKLWQNHKMPLDVNGDGAITSEDADAVIAYLNQTGDGALPAMRVGDEPYYDVNGSGSVTPIDSLLIINWLGAQ